ncbi:peptidase C19 family protein [Cavenderia fasciculata]|uniref:Peptidase C19 family protein n=1 Tax=Cavenderia fasciculata TaxID=261658 RepID=F4Q704_CACFS|nr:peptidase C19 family protein [Cavenderia fasciculata]EGG16186.1 peptidase C19 family protein [Cavenderia fasciculata]|eukprot:XP_004354570.1 peptidase C19 family protein [Cavenderia fasciculata]
MTPELKNDLYSLGLKDLGLEEQQSQQSQQSQSQQQDQSTSSSITTTTTNQKSIGEVASDNTTTMSTTSTTMSRELTFMNEDTTSTTATASSSATSTIGPNIFSDDVFGLNDDIANTVMNTTISFADYDQDYVQSILAFGFEEYKVLAGLKKFPSTYQQEKLIDWILTANEEDFIIDQNQHNNQNNNNSYNNNNDVDNDYNMNEISTYPPTPTYATSEEYFGAFSNTGFQNDNDNNQNKAIVLYNSEQQQNIFTMPQDNNQNNQNNEGNNNNNQNNNETTSTTATVSNNNNNNQTKQKKKGRIIAYELQRLFSMLQKGDVSSISTENLTRSFGWDSGQVVQQQDIHELNRILFDAVEHSLKGTTIQDLIVNLYRGVLINRIECTNCGKIKDREEFFQDVPVAIKGFKTLEESFKSFVTPEVLDGDNKYFCDSCNERVKATIGVKMGKLPPVLTIPLRRFDFDMKRGSRVKITSKFKFPNTINMTKYTAEWSTYEKDLENGLKPVKPKDQYYELFAVLIHSGGAYGGHYHSYIKDVSNQVNIPQDEQKDQKENEEEQAKDQKDVNNNNNNNNNNNESQDKLEEQEEGEEGEEEKESSSVSSSKKPIYSGWFDFNDSSVTIIPDSSIEKQFGNKHESAYMLVYRSKELGENLKNDDIPNHLKKEIEAFNLTLEDQRMKYETSVNTLFVYPKFIGHDYKVVDGQLVEIKEAEKVKIRQDQGRDDEEEQLKLDIGTSVQELYRLVRENYADRFSQTDVLVIQEIQSTRDGRVQLATPLSSVSSLGIKKAGLREGERLLIWNGTKVHGVHTPPIRFCAKMYIKDSTTNQVNVEERYLSIERESTFANVQQLLSKESGIPLDKLVVYNLVNSNLVPMEDDMPNVPLGDRIFSGTELYVEERTPNSSLGEMGTISKSVGQSMLMQEFERHRDKVHIFVTDRIDYNDNLAYGAPPPPHKLFVDTGSTIYQLKEMILDIVRPNLSTQQKQEFVTQTIIRKTQVGGSPGTIISDDTFSLQHVGLSGGSLIIIERGTVTTPTITLNIMHEDLGKHSINYSKKNTILSLKKYLLRFLGLNISENESNYILKTSDVFDQPDVILVDEDRTLEEGAIRNEDTLFLERGILPSKDQILLKFSVYRFNNGTTTFTRFSLPASPALHLNPQFIPQTADLYTVSPIGDFPVDKKTLVSQLKQLVLEWGAFRELLSKEDVEKLDAKEMDIRLWNDEKLLTSFTGMSKSLAKLHVQQEANIIIEFNDDKQIMQQEQELQKHHKSSGRDDQEESRPQKVVIVKDKKKSLIIPKQKKVDQSKTPPPILLYIHKRLPESQSFEYPPTQAYFTGKDINDLKQFISETTKIEPQYLKIFKYVTHQRINPWRIIEARRKKQSKKQFIKHQKEKSKEKEKEKDSTTTTVSISKDLIIDIINNNNNNNNNSQVPDTTNLEEFLSDDEMIEDDIESSQVDGETSPEVIDVDLDVEVSQDTNNNNNNSNIPRPPPPPPKQKKLAAIQHNPNELRGKPWLFRDGDMIAYIDTRDDPEDNDKFALAMDLTTSFSSKYSFSGTGHREQVVKYRAPEVELKIQLDDY